MIKKNKGEHIASVVKGVDVRKANSSEELVGKFASIVFYLHLRLTCFPFMFVFPRLKKYSDYNHVVNLANAALKNQFQLFNLRFFKHNEFFHHPNVKCVIINLLRGCVHLNQLVKVQLYRDLCGLYLELAECAEIINQNKHTFISKSMFLSTFVCSILVCYCI